MGEQWFTVLFGTLVALFVLSLVLTTPDSFLDNWLMHECYRDTVVVQFEDGSCLHA